MSTGRPRGYRFPLAVVQHAVWLYARFTLSLRDVEELLAERGIVVSYETVRAWFARFGPAIARGLRARRRGSSGLWHLDGICQVSRQQVIHQHFCVRLPLMRRNEQSVGNDGLGTDLL
jgi:transposase-like protein